MKGKKKQKILRFLWNMLYKNNGNLVSVLLTKIQVSERLNKIDLFFYQIMLFVARENQLLLKIKNSQMISLK